MRCSEVSKFVYVYLDGEFEPRECAEFEQHVQSCGVCRDRVEFERTFHALLRERLARPTAPAALRGRILAEIDRTEPSGALGRVLPFPLAVKLLPALAAAAVAAVVLWPSTPDDAARGRLPSGADEAGVLAAATATLDDPMEGIVAETVKTHEAALPTEVYGDRAAIGRFLTERVAFKAAPPFEDSRDMRLVGARLAQVRNAPAVLYIYDHKGKRLSVLQFNDEPRPRTAFRNAYYTGRLDGYNVALFRDQVHGLTTSVAGEVPEHELLTLIPATYQR